MLDARRCWLVVAAVAAAATADSSFTSTVIFAAASVRESFLPSFLSFSFCRKRRKYIPPSKCLAVKTRSTQIDAEITTRVSLPFSFSLLYIDPFAFFYDLVRNRPKITKVRSVYISLLPLPLLALSLSFEAHTREEAESNMMKKQRGDAYTHTNTLSQIGYKKHWLAE